MQKVVPFLMFVGDQCGRAEEAIDLYVSAFPESRILSIERFGDEEAGGPGVRHARFEIAGHEVAAIDSPADHRFTFTPAISLFVECDDEDDLDAAWRTLAQGGDVLMPLQAYDFSPKFGWCKDRFGVTWQLSLPLAPA